MDYRVTKLILWCEFLVFIMSSLLQLLQAHTLILPLLKLLIAQLVSEHKQILPACPLSLSVSFLSAYVHCSSSKDDIRVRPSLKGQ
jgi:hypothetical protein